MKELQKEIPFKWRVQSVNEYGANCVAYIDARDVQDTLDKVVGPQNWQVDYKQVGNLFMAGIGIKKDDTWVWKWDTGSESNIEKEKGHVSDAFKRAGVMWGIGRFLYSLDVPKLKTKQHTNKKYYPITRDGQILWSGADLTEYINATLKARKSKK